MWDAAEREAWTPRPRTTPGEWAEENRYLSPLASPSHPGQYRHIAPWQAGLLDLICDPLVGLLVILKMAQGSISELIRTAIGWSADVDPKPVLWVMTTQIAAESSMEKLTWMLQDTPCLERLIGERARDTTVMGATLANGMEIGIGWSNSPQALASDPWCWVVLDEVAKYKATVGGEGAIVKNAAQRTKVFGLRGKQILLSSPKHDGDNICKAHEDVEDKRRFYVPCRSCSRLQPLDWDWVRWPGGDPSRPPTDPQARLRLASEVEAAQSAWIECRHCKEPFDPRAAMNAPTAAWVREIEGGGFESDPAPSRQVAVQISELYHWKTTVSDLAAKFLRALTPHDLQDFWNGCLGLPFKSERSAIPAELFASRATFPSRVVPAWATTVIATADTQLHGWWYMIRAWGTGGRSRLLDFGWCPRGATKDESKANLLAVCSDVRFTVEGCNDEARPLAFVLDTGGGLETPDGSLTSEVYDLVRTTPRAYALKGEGDRESLQGTPWRTSKVTYSAERYGDVEVDLHLVNKNYYADELAALIRADKPVKWEECQGAADKVYTRQMASEHLVLLSSGTGSKWLWQKRSKGLENHLWDCARYQCWAAEFCRVEDRRHPTWGPAMQVAGYERKDAPKAKDTPVRKKPEKGPQGPRWRFGR